MKKLNKSAFTAIMALVCYASFASAQAVSFDKPSDELSKLVNDLKFGGPGGHGGPGGPGGFGDHGGPGGPGGHGGFNPNPPAPFNPGGHGDHGGPGGPGHHDGPGPQPGPWHPQPGPQPGPWHPQPPMPFPPQPGPHPDPWHPQPPMPFPPQPGPQPWHPGPGPQPGPWQPHHGGHPDWDHNDWNNNHWNQHGPDHNGWWNDYNGWWNNNSHPYSMYRTVCDVVPGVSAKGFIVERTMPFNARATFFYYDAYNNIIRTSNPMNGVWAGGNGTPIFDFYQVPQADHCFLAITQ